MQKRLREKLNPSLRRRRNGDGVFCQNEKEKDFDKVLSKRLSYEHLYEISLDVEKIKEENKMFKKLLNLEDSDEEDKTHTLLEQDMNGSSKIDESDQRLVDESSDNDGIEPFQKHYMLNGSLGTDKQRQSFIKK